jgi:hypothetical protein
MKMPATTKCDLAGIKKDGVAEMLERFIPWVESVNYESFDWWDIWGSSWGRRAKILFLRNKIVGAAAVIPVLIADIIYPQFRSLFVMKRQFPVSTCQIALGYLHLFEISRNDRYLKKAEAMVPVLIGLASVAARNLGWGIRHEWTTVQGTVKSDTPCHTQTAYGYEFFVKLYDLTGNATYKDYIERIARHICYDYPEWWDGDKLTSAYSTMDRRSVVNANAYRMYMLLDAAERFENDVYREKGLATLRYVLSTQNPDGAFPYSADQSFVDGFHTCFVLKNICKIRLLISRESIDVERALKKGVDYYLEHLISADGYPIPFSVKPRGILYEYDCYDFAECINLLVDLKIRGDIVQRLIDFVRVRFQTNEGWFIFRLYPLVRFKGVPYMRSANAAMFLALAKSALRA